MGKGELEKNNKRWREWDVKGVKNVEYVKNVEIIKGRDAVKGIPSF